MMYKNILYFSYINKIGGVESFFYYLAKQYKDYDITIIYKSGDREQIKRLRNYVRVVKYKGQEIECDKAFFNYSIDIIDNVKAKEYYQIIHADYKAQGLKPILNKKLKYIGVSKLACDSFEELTGIKPILIYNPIEIDKPKKVLNLISATRLTKEKGKERIIKLGRLLNENNIPYIWTIFTDDINVIDNPNIVYMKPRLDITNYIANSDYLIQLSDNEAYCYSVVESLLVGTPVIVTDMPVMKEIGINKDNGFILDFDLNNVPIKEIYEKKFNFKYEPPKSEWDKYLQKGKSTYQEELKKVYKVEAIIEYDDLELKRRVIKGERFDVSRKRIDILLGDNDDDKQLVEIVE